jgi:hypothetical protein
LKELETWMPNEEDYDNSTFQCDDVLEKLKTINEHTSSNVLKRRWSFINGARLTLAINVSINI